MRRSLYEKYFKTISKVFLINSRTNMYMILKIILFSYFFIHLTGCTATPVYYSFELLSSVNNKYKFKLDIEKYTCNKEQDDAGMYFYPESCSIGGVGIYIDSNMAKMALARKAERMCDGQIKFMGKETAKEFVGMSGSYCSGVYGSNTYSGRYYSSCTGSYPMYDYSVDIYYQCIPRVID